MEVTGRYVLMRGLYGENLVVAAVRVDRKKLLLLLCVSSVRRRTREADMQVVYIARAVGVCGR